MKKAVIWILSAIIAACIAATTVSCGGGGGGTGGSGGSATLIGRVNSISTGGPVSPPANVQTSGNSTTTDSTDGSFSLSADSGTTSVTVTGSGFSAFTFTFPAASGLTDIGDLWVGPEKITLHGRVINSTNNAPVANAVVRFAGISATTGVDGVFDIPGVAYDSAHTAAFWGIVGTVQAPNFFKVDFNAAPNLKDINNVVTVDDILVTPSNDNTPPPPPYNITGRVLPIGGSSGTVVTLLESGIPVRLVNLDTTGRYTFWITPGSYTITYVKGAQTAPTQNVTLTDPNQTVNVPDVTLSP